MNKIFITIVLALLFLNHGKTQIPAAPSIFQYSMTGYQPTAFSNNYFDKIGTERGERSEKKIFKNAMYANVSTRGEFYFSDIIKPALVTSAATVDWIPDPQFNKMPLKLGIGVLHHAMDPIQLISPFVNISYVLKPKQLKWGLMAGFGWRFSNQRFQPKDVLYKDMDRKIALANEAANANFNTLSLSAALVHVEKCYFGIGWNRVFDKNNFGSPQQKQFTEWNALAEYVLVLDGLSHKTSLSGGVDVPPDAKERQAWSHHHFSMVTRYVSNGTVGKYPLHAQFNWRASLNKRFWGGLGANTANRVQFLLGVAEHRSNQDGENSKFEYQIWFSCEPFAQYPYKRAWEVNFGFLF